MKACFSFLFADLRRFVLASSFHKETVECLDYLFEAMEESYTAILMENEYCSRREAVRKVLCDFKKTWWLIHNSPELYKLLSHCSRIHTEMYEFYKSLDWTTLEDLEVLMRIYIRTANSRHHQLFA